MLGAQAARLQCGGSVSYRQASRLRSRLLVAMCMGRICELVGLGLLEAAGEIRDNDEA
jgi:hypothetical protein